MPLGQAAVPADPLQAQGFRTQRAELPEDQKSHGSSLNLTVSGEVHGMDNPEAIPKITHISEDLGESVESIREAVRNELKMYSELQGNLESYVEIHGRLVPKEVVARLAGFFDGEGCIATSSRKSQNRSPQIYLKMSQVNYIGSLILFQEIFGGHIWEVKRRTTKGKIVFSYRSSPRFLGRIALVKMLPYLREKRDQAVVALAIFSLDDQLRNGKRSGFKTMKYSKERKQLFDLLKSLKKRGQVTKVTA
jgi:intein/homing endonuclease